MVKNLLEISRSDYSTFGYPEGSDFSLPTGATIGISDIFQEFLFSLDNEIIYGHYGGDSKRAKFWFIRAGLEKPLDSRFTLRCGLIVPAIAQTSSLGDMRDDLPWPKMGGTLGLGVTWGRFIIDLAVFGDPARSYVDQEIRIRGAASLTMVL
ncbi:MAG: hypothetical protein WA081_12780 [Desulfosalsimonadaceae bacterium]